MQREYSPQTIVSELVNVSRPFGPCDIFLIAYKKTNRDSDSMWRGKLRINVIFVEGCEFLQYIAVNQYSR